MKKFIGIISTLLACGSFAMATPAWDTVDEKYISTDLRVPAGRMIGFGVVNKFGHAHAGIQTTITDIWDRADATPTQQTWVAPTQARVHTIVSTSDLDQPGSGGGATMKVFGLTDWDTKEASETVTLDGTGIVTTANSYVIIHRMRIVTKGATNVNVGTITATAVTDATVTAQIGVGNGQTLMAIYGIPSVQCAYVTRYYGSVNKAQGAAAAIEFEFMVNPTPKTELLNYLVKNTRGVQSTGNSDSTWVWSPYYKIDGPAILKIRGTASAADIDGSAGFDLILVDK